jgi:hypothetical protein
MRPALPAPAVAPSPAPAGAKRYSWHVAVYAGALAAVLVAEQDGVRANMRQRAEVKAGLRERPDYTHRTFSECTWAVFGFHPDDLAGGDVRFGKLRRFAWGVFSTWYDDHVRYNGRAGLDV